MKSARKFMASVVLGTCLLTGGIFVNANMLEASASFGTDPAMYTNIVNLGDGLYRADIICENLPDLEYGGFHVDIGNGWSFVTNGTNVIFTSTKNINFLVVEITSSRVDVGFFDNVAFDPNGTLVSVYLNKSNLYSSSNATVNIDFGQRGKLVAGNGANYFPNSTNYPLFVPEMTASYEYKIGDVNGNNKVTAIDASLICVALSNNNDNSIDVNGQNIYFPNAIALEVADVDRDGYITSYDAQYVLTYCSYVAGDLTPVGTYYTGEWDIYEVYNI